MTFLAAGTLIVWVAIFVYTVSLGTRLAKLQRRLEEMKQALDEKGA